MDAWAKHLANGREKAAERPRKARAVGEEASMRELLVILAKLGLKNAQDVRLLSSLAYTAIRLDKDSEIAEAVRSATKLHADRTRGKSGHGEGAPDPLAFAAVLVECSKRADEPQKKTIVEFCTAYQPGSPVLQHIVPCCRLQKCHDSSKVKLFLKLRRGAGLSDRDASILEDVVMGIAVASGGEQLHGQATRGAMERRAQDLLKELGVDSVPNAES